ARRRSTCEGRRVASSHGPSLLSYWPPLHTERISPIESHQSDLFRDRRETGNATPRFPHWRISGDEVLRASVGSTEASESRRPTARLRGRERFEAIESAIGTQVSRLVSPLPCTRSKHR